MRGWFWWWGLWRKRQQERAETPTRPPATHNDIGGGNFNGPVIQVGTAHGLNFPPPAAAPPPHRTWTVSFTVIVVTSLTGMALVAALAVTSGGTSHTPPAATPSITRKAQSPRPVGERGHLYSISLKDSSVLSWIGGTSWSTVGPTAAGKIAAGPAGLFATGPEGKEIFRYRGAGGSTYDWERLGEESGDLRLAVGDHLWVRTDRNVRQWNPSTGEWTTVGITQAAEIYAGPLGLFATDPDGEHKLRHRVPDTVDWLFTGDGARGFAMDAQSLYRLDKAGSQVYRWNGRDDLPDWTLLGPDTFDTIHAGPAGLFAARGGKLFAYDEPARHWRDTGGTAPPGASYAVAADHVYRQDSGGVWQWTGTPGQDGVWLRIGDPVKALAASA